MQRIGFVGLGMMGGPMAANLLAGGFQVTAYDVQPERTRELVARGAAAAEELEAVAACDAVLVMVNTDAQARDVIGRLIAARRGRPGWIASMSTILPSTIRELGETAAAAGVGVLDAPVSGGPIVARAAGLSIMVGGEETLYDTALPILETMGRSIRHVGPLGAGLTAKLVNNMIAISALPLVAEALRIGLSQGLELSTMVEVIRASSGNTWITEQWDQAKLFLAFMLDDPAQLDSLVGTGIKDMELAATLCDEGGLEAPLLRHAIASLERHGVEGLRADLAALHEAVQRG